MSFSGNITKNGGAAPVVPFGSVVSCETNRGCSPWAAMFTSSEIAGKLVRVEQRPPAGSGGVLARSGHKRGPCSQGRRALRRGARLLGVGHVLRICVCVQYVIDLKLPHAYLCCSIRAVIFVLFVLYSKSHGGSKTLEKSKLSQQTIDEFEYRPSKAIVFRFHLVLLPKRSIYFEYTWCLTSVAVRFLLYRPSPSSLLSLCLSLSCFPWSCLPRPLLAVFLASARTLAFFSFFFLRECSFRSP